MKNNTKVYLATDNAQICSFCSKEHHTSGCSEFSKLTVNNRLKQIKEKRLCIKCLPSGHFIRECRSSLCRKCGNKHHILLHIDNPNNQVEDNQQTQCCLNRNAKQSTRTLLATALIKVLNAKGKWQQGWTILDSDFQSNLITSEFCNLLSLKKLTFKITISGGGTVTSN